MQFTQMEFLNNYLSLYICIYIRSAYLVTGFNPTIYLSEHVQVHVEIKWV